MHPISNARLKVVTWNIGSPGKSCTSPSTAFVKTDIDRIITLSDVLFLQEVPETELAHIIETHTKVFNVFRFDPKMKGPSYPFLVTLIRKTAGTEFSDPNSLADTHSRYPRALAVFDTSHKRVYINIHLKSNSGAGSTNPCVRLAQVMSLDIEIKKWIQSIFSERKKLPFPADWNVFLGGDFNCERPEALILLAQLNNPHFGSCQNVQLRLLENASQYSYVSSRHDAKEIDYVATNSSAPYQAACLLHPPPFIKACHFPVASYTPTKVTATITVSGKRSLELSAPTPTKGASSKLADASGKTYGFIQNFGCLPYSIELFPTYVLGKNVKKYVPMFCQWDGTILIDSARMVSYGIALPSGIAVSGNWRHDV